MKKCGIILYNMDTQKYLLVHGKKSMKWGFPKGHMEPGETEEETAHREFYEETGIYIRQPLINKIRFKNNIYFRLSIRTNELPTIASIPDKNEIEKAEWFSQDDLIRLNMNDCNFGLKNWINYFLSYPRTLVHVSSDQDESSCAEFSPPSDVSSSVMLMK